MEKQTFIGLKKTLATLLLIFFAVSMTAVAVATAQEGGPYGYPGDHHDNHYKWDGEHMWWHDGNNNWMWDGHYWWDNEHNWRYDGQYWRDIDDRRWDEDDSRWY